MRSLFRFMLMLSVMNAVTGCAALNSDFECPARSGIPCKSVDQINDLVDQGQFDPKASEDDFHPFSTPVSVAPSHTASDENALSVWIAPYHDEEGNLHQDHRLFAATTSTHAL